MTEACQHLHEALSRSRRFKLDELGQIPSNGVYALFEKGEEAHGGDRIVRIGTHTGQDILQGRMREHFEIPRRYRSILRSHIGCCLLAKASDPFLAHWRVKRSSKVFRSVDEAPIDQSRLKEVEADVTRYLQEKFAISVLPVDSKEDRIRFEKGLLSTIYHCTDCGPSVSWLGKFHPSQDVIRKSGLWNVQDLRGKALTIEEVRQLIAVSLR